VPVVPLVLLGGRHVLPFGGGVVQSGKIYMRVLPPIQTAGLSLKDRGALTSQVRAMVLAELASSHRPLH
jgi:hypothetical protein